MNLYSYLKGTNYDVRYPYMIISGLTLVGFIAALFLPETLHQKLANTLQEAQKFGKDQVRDIHSSCPCSLNAFYVIFRNSGHYHTRNQNQNIVEKWKN